MIRTAIAFNVNALTVRNLNAYDHLISNGPHIQCVRWKRKPIWLPTAKSKMFRVPQRKVIPTEEMVELKRLHNNYRTLMKSVIHFFVEKEDRKVHLDHDTAEKNVKADFIKCTRMNDAWNKVVASMREHRLEKRRIHRTEEITLKIKEKEERDLKIQQAVDAEIKTIKEEVVTFITAENVDEAIDNALENIVNHNFAIDSGGNCYKGKTVTLETSTTSIN